MTEIDDKYAELGGPASFLGAAITSEDETADGIGHFRHFDGGSIYWSPTTGAHEVHGAIRDKWEAMGWETSVIGYPLTDESATPDGVGRYSHFEWGSIYWTPSLGAHEVHGFIRARWAELGWERSPLGYPTSDERDTPGLRARISDFEGGSICWDEARGPYEVLSLPAPLPADPPTRGSWQVAPFDSDVAGVHAALLHTNRVLFFSYRDPGPDAPEEPQEHGDSALLDLAAGTVTRPQPAAGERNLFCAGQAFLADGRLLIGGGERLFDGLRSLHMFDPSGAGGGAWQYLRDLAVGRWYPTCVTLPDGRVFICGGINLTQTESNADTTYEIFDVAAGLQPLNTSQVLMEAGPYVTFPFVYVLPDHKLFMHAGTRSRLIDLDTWSDLGVAYETADRPRRGARTYNVQGTSVLLPLRPGADPYRARIMVVGGGAGPTVDIRSAATPTCEVLDLGEDSPAWRLRASMHNPRVMPDAVLLPDGKVFVTNGSSTGFADNGANPVYEAEIYDPEGDTWTRMASMSVPRLYHASALLLPDGRVMTAGSDSMWNPDPFHESQLRIEFFSPPYLFAGGRPSIADAPDDVQFGADFVVQTADAASVDSVALLRAGSTTHSFNSDQRYVALTISARSAGSVTLTAPPDGFVAPPGYYLLFLLRAGVPSVGRFLRVGP